MGQYGVFVPGAPIKKIRRSKEGIVDKKEVWDDGSMQLHAGQLDETAASLLKGFTIGAAAGTHLGLLQSHRAAPAAETEQPLALPDSAAQAPEAKPVGWGFFAVSMTSSSTSQSGQIASPGSKSAQAKAHTVASPPACGPPPVKQEDGSPPGSTTLVGD